MYEAGFPPQDPAQLPAWLMMELAKLQEALAGQTERTPFVSLAVAPTKPREGDVAYADGSSWAPGYGEGLYSYNGSAWKPLQRLGTVTNDSAAAGEVGEIITATVASGSAVSLTTATAANVTSISLTAGDWDVSGQIDYTLTGSTSTLHRAGISLTTATMPTQAGGSGLGTDPLAVMPLPTTTLSATMTQAIGPVRLSINSTTTVYLVAEATFSAGTEAAFGTIRARRVR